MYFQAILFDLNGTVIEIFQKTEYRRHVEMMAAALDLQYSPFMEAWQKSYDFFPNRNYPTIEARMDVALKNYDGLTAMPTNFQVQRACQIRYDYIAGQQLKIRDGVLNFLAWASQQGYRLGMVSNCTTETPMAWPMNPMSKYIPNPTFSCVVGYQKPDPQIFLHALKNLDFMDPKRCIYVADGDDHEFDTAVSLGMQPVLITYPIEDAFRHEPFPEIEYSIEDFAELRDIIKKLEIQMQN
jgi:putative hydrolase of the HAD superfamily